jgi:hypothetical protein
MVGRTSGQGGLNLDGDRGEGSEEDAQGLTSDLIAWRPRTIELS